MHLLSWVLAEAQIQQGGGGMTPARRGSHDVNKGRLMSRLGEDLHQQRCHPGDNGCGVIHVAAS